MTTFDWSVTNVTVTYDNESGFDIPKLELQGFNNSGRRETGEFRADLDGSNRET